MYESESVDGKAGCDMTPVETGQYKNYFREFRDIIQHTCAICPVSEKAYSINSLQEVLDMVVNKFRAVLDAKGALLRILNEETNQFEVGAACGMGRRYLSKGPVSAGKVLPDTAELHNVFVISDIWRSSRVEYPRQAWEEGVRMMLDVPIAVGDRAVGKIRIYLPVQREFSEDELDFIVTVADQCACVIERIKQMERQQVQFNRLATQMEKLSSLGRMAAGIAHEINNPLGGILLYSSNMIKKVEKGSSIEDGLGIIIKETQRCKKIIEGLLEFARDRELQKTPADINDIVESAVNIVENEFLCAHVKIEKNLAENMATSLLDENQIEQVLINLLLNALHSVEESGCVSLSSSFDSGKNRVFVEITDNGAGIAQENIGRIFEPFFSTKVNGTGLGLAVSYGIVSNHQGDIHVASKLGKGTRFTIELPVNPDNNSGCGML